MGTFLKIDDDPNRIGGTGAVLRAMAESFKTESSAVLGEIQAIDAEQPWAQDQYGQAFQSKYSEVQDGQEVSARDYAQTQMSDAGDRLIRVGEQTVLAMSEYQGVDQQGATEIHQANI